MCGRFEVGWGDGVCVGGGVVVDAGGGVFHPADGCEGAVVWCADVALGVAGMVRRCSVAGVDVFPIVCGCVVDVQVCSLLVNWLQGWVVGGCGYGGVWSAGALWTRRGGVLLRGDSCSARRCGGVWLLDSCGGGRGGVMCRCEGVCVYLPRARMVSRSRGAVRRVVVRRGC